MQVYSLIHAVGTGAFGYATYYEFFVLHAPRHFRRTADVISMGSGPGKWKYLTVWNLVMQFAYHSYSLTNNVAGTSTLVRRQQSLLQKIRDFSFASLIFPVGSFVCISFWTLYAIDRELVFPAILDSFYPKWLNHTVHTLPIVINCIEIYVTPRTYPKQTLAVVGNLTFSLSYTGWVTHIAQKYGVWAYKVLEVLGTVSRSIFLGSGALMILGLYFVGEKIHQSKWEINAIEDDTPAVDGVGKNKKL